MSTSCSLMFSFFRSALAPIIVIACMSAYSAKGEAAGVETVIDSDITTDTQWSLAGSPYTIATGLDILNGATLTIEAGVRVEFNSGFWMDVENGGSLQVDGTPGSNVVFTSSAPVPAPGDWGYIKVQQGGTASISHCEISNAGALTTDAIRILSTSSVTVSDCDIHDNLDEGIQISGGEDVKPTITNTTIRDNGDGAAEQGGNTEPTWSNITINGNGDNSIFLVGDYTVPVVLDGSGLNGGSFKADTSIDINSGGILTFAAGTTLTFENGQWLDVNNGGALQVEGTGANPVVFTSSQAVPQPGDWGYLYVYQGGTAAINNCEISYAGASSTDALRIFSTSAVTVSNCDIHDNLDEGIQIGGGENVKPVITNTTIRDNGDGAAEQAGNTEPTWSNITINGNGDNSIYLTGDYTVPVVLDGSSLSGGGFQADTSIDINAGGILTFAAGTTLTFENGQWLDVNNGGALQVEGTGANPVVFTSSQAVPQPGDWGYLYVYQGGTAAINNCEISYAGASSTDALRIFSTSAVTVSDCDIHDNLDEGVQIGGGENVKPVITNTTIRNNGDGAADQAGNTEPTWSNITISGNGDNSIFLTGDYTVPVLLDGSGLTGGSFKAYTSIDINAGGILTLAAGTTLTFDTGQWLDVNNGGSLIVAGTAARPVLLTSGESAPAPGDWQYVAVNSGGTASLWHCWISYAGSSLGALRVYTSANTTIYGCDFHHNAEGGLAVNPAATVNIINSVFHDNGATAIEVLSGSTLTAINNTITANDVGIDIGTANVTLTNNLITHNATTGVVSSDDATLTIRYNNVYNPDGTNYSGIPDPTGSNGNVSVDPAYQGPHFALANDSPVIDAGTSSGAPPSDFADRLRRDHPNVANTGGGAKPWFDLGAQERFCTDDGVDGHCELFSDGFADGTLLWSAAVGES